MKNINIIILFFLISSQLTFSQDYSVSTGDLFSGGNVMLRKLMERDYDMVLVNGEMVHGDAEGSPYLNDEFTKGKLIFDNGKKYDALTRLNVGTQKFEIKKNLNSPASLININEFITVQMNNKKYNLHSINLNNEQILAILEDCINSDNISLFYFPRKVIKFPPVKMGAVAPSSGSTKAPKPKWVDANEFLINKDGKWHSIPRSFKKLLAKNIFDQKLLKKYKKANKLNLKNKESLMALVSYFNSI